MITSKDSREANEMPPAPENILYKLQNSAHITDIGERKALATKTKGLTFSGKKSLIRLW